MARAKTRKPKTSILFEVQYKDGRGERKKSHVMADDLQGAIDMCGQMFENVNNVSAVSSCGEVWYYE